MMMMMVVVVVVGMVMMSKGPRMPCYKYEPQYVLENS
jgi:hypothetical protein